MATTKKPSKKALMDRLRSEDAAATSNLLDNPKTVENLKKMGYTIKAGKVVAPKKK